MKRILPVVGAVAIPILTAKHLVKSLWWDNLSSRQKRKLLKNIKNFVKGNRNAIIHHSKALVTKK